MVDTRECTYSSFNITTELLFDLLSRIGYTSRICDVGGYSNGFSAGAVDFFDEGLVALWCAGEKDDGV